MPIQGVLVCVDGMDIKCGSGRQHMFAPSQSLSLPSVSFCTHLSSHCHDHQSRQNPHTHIHTHICTRMHAHANTCTNAHVCAMHARARVQNRNRPAHPYAHAHRSSRKRPMQMSLSALSCGAISSGCSGMWKTCARRRMPRWSHSCTAHLILVSPQLCL